MKKKVFWLVLLLCFACAGACGAGEEAPIWANVRDYGAVGDAVYHYPFGTQLDDYSYRVGHYSRLVTKKFQVPYSGPAGNAPSYQVVEDCLLVAGRRIWVSAVCPGWEDYIPAVGDTVVQYTAADPEASVAATDDSAAFEAAIAAGSGCVYLPEGDYMVSQLTAAKLQDIRGPGRIWLKEWNGGTTYYLTQGKSVSALAYRNYGWIDETRFHDPAWKAMHWVTCLPQVYGWETSKGFSGNISPRMEFPFDRNRDELNVWLTVQPAVPEEEFPDTVTVCIAGLSANYTVKGETEWRCASGDGAGGGLFRLNWSGTSEPVPEGAWKDCGSWIEITLRREDLFRHNADGKLEGWSLHCWSLPGKHLSGKGAEYVCNSARVWVKEADAEGCLMCDIGGDMRTEWKKRDVKEGYVLEACDSATQYLTAQPQQFWAYTVPDGKFDQYTPFPS